MRKFIFLLIISFPLVLFAQKKDYNTYDKALKYIRDKQPDKAKALCLKLIKKDPNWRQPHLLISSIYKNEGDILSAVKYLLNVYNENNLKDVDGIEAVGKLYYENGIYDGALYYFNKCIELKKRKKIDLLFFIENCLFAINAKKNPVPFNSYNMGSNINSELAEYLPAITADDNKIVFTRRVEEKDKIPQEDFFISNRGLDDSFELSYPFNLSPINTPSNEGALSFSADQSMIIYTACERPDGFGSCDLYLSSSSNWDSAINVGSQINSKYWDSQGCFSPDGRFLYFVSNRPGGFGGKDIWVSEISNRFQRAYNLGPLINTEKDEMSPFLHADNLTLYFASNGHIGMGDYDIFISRREDIEQDWGEPRNLGFPINTHLKENSLIVSSDGQTAYYASDQDGFGKEDIFYFKLPEKSRAQELSKLEMNIITQNSGEEVILNNVHFRNNSYKLEEESFSELNQLIKYLKKNSYVRIRIEGHTDNIGDEKDNLELSSNRAKTVFNYLLENNIIKKRLFYQGFGESSPISDNTTEEGRARNRRTSFVILP